MSPALMTAGRAWRGLLFAVGAIALLAPPGAGAQSDDESEPFLLSAPPREPLEVAERVYKPVAEFLSEVTEQEFVYEYPDNPLSYWQDLQQDKYDIVFDESHFTSWMILNHQHLPLVKVSGALIYVYYIDSGNEELSTLEDLAGGTVCGQSPPNQGTLALFEQFDNPFRIPHLVPFEGWERIYEAVGQRECTAGIAPLQLFDQLNNGEMHPLYMTRPVPNQTFAAGRRLSPQLKSRITAALLSEAGHQATAPLRDLYNIAGFERAFEVEYIGHDKVLTDNYRFDFVSE